MDANYDKLNEDQRRKAIKEIAKSSNRLSSLTNNMIDLSKLSSMNYELKRKIVDLADLLHSRIEICKTIYLGNKDLEFILKIEEETTANCDEYYLTSTLDNLIINAIQYSNKGKIVISLGTVEPNIEFMISDEGIGIPQEEIYDIFGAFVVSSKTRTIAGNRGIGLALCKKVIELHGGYIQAENNGEKGATFRFILPK